MYRYRYGWPARGRAYPLDPLPQLYASGALRRLRGWHTGELILARRDSDGDLEAFRAGADGWVDLAAVLAWCGSASAYLHTAFDQEGRGRDIVQATAAWQPCLVAAGVPYLGPLGHLAPRFDGVDDRMEIASSTTFTSSQPAVTMAASVMFEVAKTGNLLLGAYASPGPVSRAVFNTAGLRVQAAYRRLNTDAFAQLSAAANYPTGTWTRQIARFRPDAAALDVVGDGVVTTGTFGVPGAFDSSAQIGNIVLGGTPLFAVYLAGRLSAAILAQSAVDIAALDRTLSLAMP